MGSSQKEIDRRERERQWKEQTRREREERERKERERQREKERLEREAQIERERLRKIEIERKKRERKERERQRQLNREEEITSNIESGIKNLRNKIHSFKSNFEENYYNSKQSYKIIFNEMQGLLERVENRRINSNIDYPFETKKKLQKTVINNEIKNFKKFLYEEIYYIIKNLGKDRKFSECLESIEELEENFPLDEIDFSTDEKEDYKEGLKKIKFHCESMLKRNKSKELFNQQDFDKSIKLLKELYYNSATDMERELYTKEKRNMEIEYINNITNKNINLLFSNNNDDIINESEKIFNKFNYDINLSTPLHEMKIVYCKALQNIILEKKKKGENFDEEYYKYVAIVETEKFEDEFKDFINKLKSNNKINGSIDEKSKSNDSGYDNEPKIIHIEVIKEYLAILKELNREKSEKELENDIKDIITQVENYNNEIKNKGMNFSEWIDKNKENIQKNEFRGNVFSFLNIINKPIIKYDIRPIQLISLLFLSKQNTSPSISKSKGMFLQINTGEGKSLIIQFFAAYLALQGKKVDIITSNSVLADRDAEDPNKIKFYEALGLNVGCASKEEYYKNIVYGDTQNFEAAILKEEFKEKEVRSGRDFDCIIVDEVDSISLDNIITMTQLTDSFPGRSCFYFFYYQILLIYCNYISNLVENNGKTQEEYLKNPKEFENGIKNEIKEKLKENLMENDGKTLKKDLPIIYPRCMKKYIEDSLDVWIENVIKAPTMIEGKDFIKKGNSIVPIDFSNTGVLQNNMVWDGGLQQILQIIHDENGTYENENTNFLSNISFFKRYNGNIYGVTGTFGETNFQDILKEVYEINLYKIPPNKKSLLNNLGSKICKCKEEYFDALKENIQNIISRNRSVLIICNSINEGKELYEILLEIYEPENIMKYFTEDDNATLEKTLEIKKIIVATNLAGRGTDIKISEELESNGGLHVIVSFLPLNQRIEDQNYGRAGRKGQRGSYSLIMLYNEEYGPLDGDNLNLKIIKERREKAEYDGIQALKNNEKKFIEQKEEIFKDFCNYLKEKYKETNKFIRASIEEQWGILLKGKDIDTIKKDYKNLINEDKQEIKNNLIKIQKLVKNSKIEESDKKILELEPEYSWSVRLVYACQLAKIKVKNDDLVNQNHAIIQFKKVKKILDETFMNDLSSQSALNKIVFSLFVMNKEKIEDENFKTKIELQNENKKNFLEVLKSLIDKNITTVEKYINQYKDRPDDKIETQKFLKIKEIINDSEKVDIKYQEDIEIYMYEFGLEKFEILVIRKEFHLLTNLIVFAIGILEICAGTALFYLSKNPKVLKFAKFLIQEGVSDVIKSVKATINGEEINLADFAMQKATNLLKFSLSLITGGFGPESDEPLNLKDIFLKTLKDKAIEELKNYGVAKVSEKIIQSINECFSEKIKDILSQVNILNFNNNDEQSILYDVITNDQHFKYNLIQNVKNIISNTEDLMEFIGPIISFIKDLADENNSGTEKFQSFLSFVTNFDFKRCKKCLEDIIPMIQNIKINRKIDKSLFKLISKSNADFSEDKINKIIIELIECGAINKEKGIFNMDFIETKDFVQIFKFEIDKKFKKIQFKEGKTISKEIKEFLKNFKEKFSQKTLNNEINEIKDNVYKEIEESLRKYIKMILDYLLDKASEKLEDLYNKYNHNNESVCKKNNNKNTGYIKKIGLNGLLTILTEKLLDWIKDRINELIENILSEFNELFEEIGEKIIIIQENVDNIIDEVISRVNSVIKLVEDIKSIITNIIDIIQSKGNIEVVIQNLVNISNFMLKNSIKNLTHTITRFVDYFKKELKNSVNNLYNESKKKVIESYETEKTKILKEYTKIKDKGVNLPDYLTKKLDNKKNELEKEYKKIKKKIITNTDIKLKNVIDTNQIEKVFYDIINNVKTKIDIETNKIKEEINNKLNDCNNFVIHLYNDIICFINECIKLDIVPCVDNKLDVLEGTVIFILDIIIKKYAIKIKTLDENILRQLPIPHCEILYGFLIQNKLLILKLKNKIRKYIKGKLHLIKPFYDTILNMTKKYLNLLFQEAKGYLSKGFKCLYGFDYFIQYIDKIYKKCCIYELYFINELKSINSFINDNVEKFNELKNREINNLTNPIEQEIEKGYNKLMQVKENVKDTINNTFDTFENNVIKPIDDRICEIGSDLEKKLFNVAQNVSEQAEECLQMICPNDIESKLFNCLAKKKDIILNNLINEDLKASIVGFSNSNFINKSKNIIDKIDLNKTKSMINDISRISKSLKYANKYEFRDNIKSKIKSKIMELYSTKIEKELRIFIKKACEKLIQKI